MHMHYPALNSWRDVVAKLKVAAEFTKEQSRVEPVINSSLDNFMKN
jgi:hypothetical protein